MTDIEELHDRIADRLALFAMQTNPHGLSIPIDQVVEAADAILPLVEGRIAEAVAAERERAARIAADHEHARWQAQARVTQGYSVEWPSGYDQACIDIAAAIRTPEEPKEKNR